MSALQSLHVQEDWISADIPNRSEVFRGVNRAARLLVTDLDDNELGVRGLGTTRQIASHPRWFANEDVINDLTTASKSLCWLIRSEAATARSTPPDWLAAAKARLDALRGAAVEEDIEISEPSVRAAATFMSTATGWTRPGVFLLPNGNIRLLWTNVAGEQVGLEFRQGDEVRYVMFVAFGTRTLPQSGQVPVAAVRRVIDGAGLARVMRA